MRRSPATPTGVEDQRDAEGQLLERDALNLLGRAVVGQHEVASRQALDRLAAARHRDVDLDHLDAAPEHRPRRRRLCEEKSGGEDAFQHHRRRASPRSQASPVASKPP
jgi:hypothetical protein